MVSGISAAQRPVIGEDIAAFMRGPVTLVLGASNHDKLASAVYCKGCRVDPAQRTITVFFSRTQGLDVLDNLRVLPSVALVACRPTTLRTLQLKGNDARIEPLAAGDVARVAAYVEMIVAELAQVGDEPDWSRAAFSYEANDLVAVTFTPASVFVQTPGPDAGDPIGARSTV